MRIIECQQRSAEWFAIRCGRVTCSRLADVVDRKKNGEPTAKRDAYMWELAAETITNQNQEHYVSQFMQHGMDWESTAKANYHEFLKRLLREQRVLDGEFTPDGLGSGVILESWAEVGFVLHPNIDRFGCSPDMLLASIGGGAEIKCPQSYKHLQYMTSGEVPEEYKPQVMGAMSCTNMEWWDFVSYDNKMPDDKKLFVVRVERDDFYIKWLESEVVRFLQELDALVDKLGKPSTKPNQLQREGVKA